MNQQMRVAVRVVVHRSDGRIFAVRRSTNVLTRPLCWDLPGGKVEFKETPVDAVIRETKEETGWEIKDPKILIATLGSDNGHVYWIAIGYIVQDPGIDPVLSSEHCDQKWILPDEFEKLEASETNKKIARAFKEFIDRS